jgi:hypothetical protein
MRNKCGIEPDCCRKYGAVPHRSSRTSQSGVDLNGLPKCLARLHLCGRCRPRQGANGTPRNGPHVAYALLNRRCAELEANWHGPGVGDRNIQRELHPREVVGDDGRSGRGRAVAREEHRGLCVSGSDGSSRSTVTRSHDWERSTHGGELQSVHRHCIRVEVGITPSTPDVRFASPMYAPGRVTPLPVAPRILRRDVPLQVLDRALVLGNHVVHDIADRNHAEHCVTAHDRKVADSLV